MDFVEERINNILGLPEHIQVLVPVGYPDEISKKKDEYNIKEIVFYNKLNGRPNDVLNVSDIPRKKRPSWPL